MWVSACPPLAESKFRVLYLGNDLEFLAALRRVLREPAYGLVACSDRGSAEGFLESDIRYNLLLLDFDWRGQEGLELARLAQSLKHRKKMPIVMVAAEGVADELKTLVQGAGVKKFVLKTPDAGEAGKAIREQVEKAPPKK